MLENIARKYHSMFYDSRNTELPYYTEGVRDCGMYMLPTSIF